jgi:hypothetical protein
MSFITSDTAKGCFHRSGYWARCTSETLVHVYRHLSTLNPITQSQDFTNRKKLARTAKGNFPQIWLLPQMYVGDSSPSNSSSPIFDSVSLQPRPIMQQDQSHSSKAAMLLHVKTNRGPLPLFDPNDGWRYRLSLLHHNVRRWKQRGYRVLSPQHRLQQQWIETWVYGEIRVHRGVISVEICQEQYPTRWDATYAN